VEENAGAGFDSDPEETAEWLEAFDSVLEAQGMSRAQYLFERLAHHVQTRGMQPTRPRVTPYRNTILSAAQPRYPGNLELEQRLLAAVRWNALAMVVRANRASAELGGHIASYASAAELFEVGFNHFFRAAGHADGTDLVYFQPHSSPGVYARAYLEGFLDRRHLKDYRREITGPGLLRERREALGGYLPRRRQKSSLTLKVPELERFAKFALESDGKEMSTTMAVVRMLSALLRDKSLGARIVPIVADEARTFGMASLFRQIGIYSPVGQLYEPEDSGSLLAYRESKSGQILEEGISEAAAISSSVAAATS
jgi:pyruvate dehydrogenase complex dehydrogenase (E1) component